MTTKSPVHSHRSLRLGAALFGLSIALGACTLTNDVTTVGSVAPNDYRLRHPIAIQEANRSIDIFVGNSRGGLLMLKESRSAIRLATLLVRRTSLQFLSGTPSANNSE